MLTKARRGITQARGRARRQALLDTARDLLRTHGLDALSLADVAAAAEIPKSSAYHFYADIHQLYAELAAAQDAELHAVLGEAMPPAAGWRAIVHLFVGRAAHYFRANPSAQQLMFGPAAPPDIKRSSRGADVAHGALLERLIDAQFQLPDIPERDRIFFRAVEAIDLMFGLSLIEDGALTDAMVEEAHKIGCAYLALYIPEFLPRRG